MSANNSELGTASATQHAQAKAPIDVQGIVKRATELNDFGHLLGARSPMPNLLGWRWNVWWWTDFKLPAKDDNIGNPVLPAIHGGVIAGFMEMSAIVQLMVFMQTAKVPKVVDFSIDYLRAGLHKDSFAECRITRQGRVANVNIDCWQTNRKQLIATARAHFLID